MEPLTVDDAADLTEIRTRYLQALHEGERELTVEFRPGAHGLDPRGVLAVLSLAPVGAPGAEIDWPWWARCSRRSRSPRTRSPCAT
jgi:hypothetical protein